MAEGSSVTDDHLDYFLEEINRTTKSFIDMPAPQTLTKAANMASQQGVDD